MMRRQQSPERLSLEQVADRWAKVPVSDDERHHFFMCPECGQAVDVRRFVDVLHHDDPGHSRLPRH